MIDEWILQDEHELEARCARFRQAQPALARGEDTPADRHADDPDTAT